MGSDAHPPVAALEAMPEKEESFVKLIPQPINM